MVFTPPFSATSTSSTTSLPFSSSTTTLNTPTSIQTATNIVKSILQIDLTDNSKDAEIIAFLVMSSAFTDATRTTIAYRPYKVAAKIFNIYPPRDGITQASGTDGVTWMSNDQYIKYLENLQRSLDAGLVGVPSKYRAVDYHTFGSFVV